MIFFTNYTLLINIIIRFFLIIRLITLTKSGLFLIIYLITQKNIS
jgi:hypothetical protein